jgi:hypothetical protein
MLSKQACELSPHNTDFSLAAHQNRSISLTNCGLSRTARFLIQVWIVAGLRVFCFLLSSSNFPILSLIRYFSMYILLTVLRVLYIYSSMLYDVVEIICFVSSYYNACPRSPAAAIWYWNVLNLRRRIAYSSLASRKYNILNKIICMSAVRN